MYRLLLGGRWDDFDTALRRHTNGWLVQSILTSDDAAVETVVFERLREAIPSARTLSLLGGARARDAWRVLAGIEPDASDRRIDEIDQRFRDELTAAETILQEAVRQQPALTDPWVHLLSTGRGLGIDLQELRTRFENAHSRTPLRPDACVQYTQALSGRSGGDDAAMFDFVRWVEAEAAADSPARVALPMAHLEYGLGSTSPVSLTEHLSYESTLGELTQGLRSFLVATPPAAGPRDLGVLNAYALAITVINAETAQLAEECFGRIDNRPTSYPWSLYEDENVAEVFAEVQRSQLRSASRYT